MIPQLTPALKEAIEKTLEMSYERQPIPADVYRVQMLAVIEIVFFNSDLLSKCLEIMTDEQKVRIFQE